MRPFTDKQIELVSNFAAQAVIAIENTRLLSELRESLQQQTATADVLKVISRSAFDLQTVLDTLTESAARLCAADRGVIFQRDGDLYRLGANYGFSREAEQYASEHPLQAGRGSVTGRVALEGRAIHIPDVLADPEYEATGYQKAFGFRTNLGVPLLRDGTTIGVFALTRDEVNPFTEKQIELATTFADQAVIAIENARLFDEVQARTRDLTESLQQQTATADVLKVISRSTFDLETVLDTLLESATRLCEGHISWIFQRDGEILRWAASYGHTAEVHARIKDYFKPLEVPVDRGSVVGRAASEAAVVHIPDVLADPEYKWGGAQKIGGYRAALGAPLLREGKVVGVIFVAKIVPQPFTDKQIELVKTFADQAVIAIENTRLLNELRQRTDDLSNRLTSRRPLPMCSRSSAARPSICRPCSIRWSNRRLACAAQNGRRSDLRRTASTITPQATAFYPNTRNACSVNRSSRGKGRSSAESSSSAIPFISSTRNPIPTPRWQTDPGRETYTRCSAYRCSAKERPSEFCFCNVASCNRFPTRRSPSLKRLPTRR